MQKIAKSIRQFKFIRFAIEFHMKRRLRNLLANKKFNIIATFYSIYVYLKYISYSRVGISVDCEACPFRRLLQTRNWVNEWIKKSPNALHRTGAGTRVAHESLFLPNVKLLSFSGQASHAQAMHTSMRVAVAL